MTGTKRRTTFMITYEFLRAIYGQPGVHKTELAHITRLNGAQVIRFLDYMCSAALVDMKGDALSLTAKGERAAMLADAWWSLVQDALREGPFARDYDTSTILELLETPVRPRQEPLVPPPGAQSTRPPTTSKPLPVEEPALGGLLMEGHGE